MLWDIFCRVIDNHGDLGVCWRLSSDLARRGQRVRLWVDDPQALDWMAPPPRPAAIELRDWPQPATDATFEVHPGDVIIEAFGCEVPDAFVARMAARVPAPRWINLEYLSAEDYVERSHGLASPQFNGPGTGLNKHFFYPGFTERTGGLLREAGLLEQIRDFDGAAWLDAHGWAPAQGERVVSLFAYANPALPQLLRALARRPTLVLACPGPLQTPAQALAQALAQEFAQKPVPHPANLRVLALPYLSQPDYDRLLWSCDLNLVRGEDSFVRAQWAGKPFIWQIYPQHDDAHHIKLEAFMSRAGLAMDWQAVWRGWNGIAPLPADLPDLDVVAGQAREWRSRLVEQTDLLTQLQGFLGLSG